MPQAATGRHRLPQVGKLSGTHSTRGAAKHAINPSNIDDMANGRLWDDHFRHLGHPPKFYRVQDASSGNNSHFGHHFMVILMKNQSFACFFPKSDFQKKKGPCQDAGHSRPEWGCTKTPIFN